MDGRTIIIHGLESPGGVLSPPLGPELVRLLQDARYQVVLLSRHATRGAEQTISDLVQRLRGADVEPASSWLVTDDPAELAAVRDTGCRTILVDERGRWIEGVDRPRFVVGTAPQAARLILSLDGRVRVAVSDGPVLGPAAT